MQEEHGAQRRQAQRAAKKAKKQAKKQAKRAQQADGALSEPMAGQQAGEASSSGADSRAPLPTANSSKTTCKVPASPDVAKLPAVERAEDSAASYDSLASSTPGSLSGDHAEPIISQPSKADRQPSPKAIEPSPARMSAFCCPLTGLVMVDPVICCGDGHSYERAAIEAWLACENVSPVTHERLSRLDIWPNLLLRRVRESHCA